MTPEGRQQVETLRAKIATFTDQPYVTAKKGDACALLSDALKVLALLLAEAQAAPTTGNTVTACRCSWRRHPHDPAEHNPDPDYGF